MALAATTAGAAEPRLDLPIGPGHEELVRGIFAPGPDGPAIEGMGIGAWTLTATVSAGERRLEVRVDFDREDLTADVQVVEPGTRRPAADVPPSVQRLAQAVRDRVDALTVDERSKAELNQTDETPPDAATTEHERATTWALLILYLLGLAAAWRAIGCELRRIRRAELLLLAVLVAAAAALVLLLPHTVAYHRGHVWSLARDVASGGSTSHQHGELVVILSRVLGAAASPGFETAAVARVGYIACIPLAWLWGRALLRDQAAALMFAGLLAVQPVLVYLGASFYVFGLGAMLWLLAGWHATVAVRTRDWRAVPVAFAAGALAASFRLTGPALAVSAALIALAARADASEDRHRARFWWAVGASAVVTVALLVPRAETLWGLQETDLKNPPRLAQMLWPSILAEGHSFAAALPPLALAGLLALVAARKRFAAARPLVLAGALLASATMLSMSGTMIGVSLLDAMRYQSWIGVPLALAAAAGFAAARAAWPDAGRAHLAAWLVAALAIAVTIWGPAHVLAIDHPEIAVWRATDLAATTLPPDAEVVAPARRGENRTQLPDAALRSMRSDVSVTAVGRGDEVTAGFWFEPLMCAIDFYLPESPDDDACDLAIRDERGRPVALRSEHGPDRRLVPWAAVGATLDVPAALSEEASATDDYWVHPPMTRPGAAVGVYRVLDARR